MYIILCITMGKNDQPGVRTINDVAAAYDCGWFTTGCPDMFSITCKLNS